MRFEKIENVEVIEDSSFVYDIELEKNHYFKANNIWTHNCRLRSNTENPYINSFGSLNDPQIKQKFFKQN